MWISIELVLVTYTIENAHAILVLLETNTSSPSVTPTVLKARCKAVVPLVVVIPYLQLTKLPNLFSNSLTYGPCPTKDVLTIFDEIFLADQLQYQKLNFFRTIFIHFFILYN